MKLFAYITNAEQFLQGDEFSIASSIHVTSHEDMSDYGWFPLGPVDINLEDLNMDDLRRAAVDEIKKDEKKEMAEHEVRMQKFEERIQKLLAIAYQPEATL
jgi:hypothetical protein